MTDQQLIEKLKEECKRVKIERNNYEIELIDARRKISKMKAIDEYYTMFVDKSNIFTKQPDERKLTDTGKKLIELIVAEIEIWRKQCGVSGWYHWGTNNYSLLLEPFIIALEEKINEKNQSNRIIEKAIEYLQSLK